MYVCVCWRREEDGSRDQSDSARRDKTTRHTSVLFSPLTSRSCRFPHYTAIRLNHEIKKDDRSPPAFFFFTTGGCTGGWVGCFFRYSRVSRRVGGLRDMSVSTLHPPLPPPSPGHNCTLIFMSFLPLDAVCPT